MVKDLMRVHYNVIEKKLVVSDIHFMIITRTMTDNIKPEHIRYLGIS